DGGATDGGGGGGSGLGGAIFVSTGGTLSVVDSLLDANSVAKGIGGTGGSSTGSDGDAAGTGAYIMSGTTLNFSITGNGQTTVADTIAGAGGLTKLGTGSLILQGDNTYTGTTNVDAGRLAVNFSITSDVNVNAAGTLGGTGTITGNVINNGTVAPGNSIAQLDIIGNYTQNASSQLEIEFNSSGGNDVLDVHGDVNLDGTVSAVAEPGVYTAGQSYTFLLYTGNRTGSFSGIIDNLAFFDAVLQYGANDVSFILQANSNNFIDIAETFNQRSVATVLDDYPVSALTQITSQMLTMTDDQVRYSLDQLSGEVYGTSVQMQFQSTTNQLQLLAQRLRPMLVGYGQVAYDDRSSANDIVLVSCNSSGEIIYSENDNCQRGRNAWGISYGLGGNAQTDGNAAGLDYGLGGVQFGMDRWVDDSTLIGWYGGYNFAQLNGQQLAQRVDSNSGQFGAYFSRDDEVDYFLATSGFGFDDYDSSRTINIGNFNVQTSAEYNGWQSASYFERGRTLRTAYGAVQPYGALQYIYLRQNSLSETGGEAANLNVAGVDANSLRSVLGTRVSRELVSKRGVVWVPQLRAAWQHEFLDTDTLIVNNFAAVPGSNFWIKGLDLGRDWALLGGGIGWQLTDQLSFSADYDAQVNDQQVFHVGSATMQYLW
ncbi:MAG: autotransporter domain-containing protein, partial [Planctomycetota bacterium]|nr:autotransporter domain-containing protein [Planctomycetota bacterium]